MEERMGRGWRAGGRCRICRMAFWRLAYLRFAFEGMGLA